MRFLVTPHGLFAARVTISGLRVDKTQTKWRWFYFNLFAILKEVKSYIAGAQCDEGGN